MKKGQFGACFPLGDDRSSPNEITIELCEGNKDLFEKSKIGDIKNFRTEDETSGLILDNFQMQLVHVTQNVLGAFQTWRKV